MADITCKPTGIRSVFRGTGKLTQAVLFGLLKPVTSYRLKGYFWSPAYKAGKWDGYTHLARRAQGPEGGIAVPSGLTDTVVEHLRRQGFLVDVAPVPQFGCEMEEPKWIGPALRDYQEAALQAAIAAGRGILKLPVRSGKTLLAARLIKALSRRTLFVVSSQILLDQAINEFASCLKGVAITAIGEGEWNPDGDIVVATIQSLFVNFKTSAYLQVSRSFPVVFLDEVHHCKGGGAWSDVALHLETWHKFGLSATVDALRKGENESDTIWYHAICGPIIHEVSLSEVVDKGHLVRPHVIFRRHNAPMFGLLRWDTTTVQEGIVECRHRNQLIARIAAWHGREHSRVLVDVNRIRHAKILTELIATELHPTAVVMLTGSNSKKERMKTLKNFASGKIRVIVGTLLGEGVDIPELDVVINAEGGMAKASMIQRLRNLTAHEGKSQAIIYDFIDDHNAHLYRWTKQRLQVYKTEPAFDIEVEDEAGRMVRRDGTTA